MLQFFPSTQSKSDPAPKFLKRCKVRIKSKETR